jgi:flagellar basal-body rod modification protein FlgD
MTGISAMPQTAEDIRSSYLNLLVTQLRHQNPMDPLDNSEMTAQLAQLSELEALQNIDSKFERVLLGVQLGQASSLIGRPVVFMPSEAAEPAGGVVQRVDVDDGQIVLTVGEHRVGLDQIRAVGG